jgi:Ca2+-binding EF-hand superfamily protein
LGGGSRLQQGKEGQITKEKFVATMARLMGNAEKAKATFEAFDVDGSG